jgi:hypothetical protein
MYTVLEASIFKDSEEAGPAGNQQWGLGAGKHPRWRNVHLIIPNEWVLGRDYSESELEVRMKLLKLLCSLIGL